MKFKLNFMKSKVAQRILLQFVLCALFPVLILCLVGLPATLAAEDGDKPKSTPGTALPLTHRFTLTLVEGDDSSVFSQTVASRNFSMHLGEKNIAFSGRLWSLADGRQMLEYSLELTQWVDSEAGGRQRRGSTWKGSTHLETGQAVEVVRFLSGSFALQIDALD